MCQLAVSSYPPGPGLVAIYWHNAILLTSTSKTRRPKFSHMATNRGPCPYHTLLLLEGTLQIIAIANFIDFSRALESYTNGMGCVLDVVREVIIVMGIIRLGGGG